MSYFLLIAGVIAYLLVVGYLGFLGYKKTTSTTDYLLAGRTSHPFIMSMSYGATFISTSAIVGFGGMAGRFGMGLLWLVFLNIFLGIFIAFVFFGERTRKMGYYLDAHTFPEFIGKRFGSKFIQVYCGVLIFIAMPLYAAVVMIGGARFVEIYMGLPYVAGLFIFTLIVASYVIAGGLKGVLYTDALQGTIMFFGMAILAVYAYSSLGGFFSAHQALTDMADKVPEPLAAMGHVGWTAMPQTFSQWWYILVTTIILGVGIGVLAQPQLVVRFMTVKSKRELNRAVPIGGLFILMIPGVAYIVGALSNVYFFRTQGVLAEQAAGGNVDKIIPLYIANAMPSWYGAVFMLILLAAAMSTLSGQLHAMGTAMSRDIYQQLTPKAKKDNTVLLTRLSIMFGILIVLWLGLILPESIIARGTAIFFGICAASFLPMYSLGLFWRGFTAAAAKISLVFGSLGSLAYLMFIHGSEAKALGVSQLLFGKPALAGFPFVFIDPIVVVLPINMLLAIVVSLFTAKQDSGFLDKLFLKK
jgi:solute:Na+ symporter, SSS family